MNRIAQLALATAFAATTFAAQAKVMGHSNYLGNFTFSSATAAVPLGESLLGEITVLNVNADTAGSYVLTYSAECAAGGPVGNLNAWLDIDLIVNGQVVAPTAGNADALCASDGTTTAADRWVRRSITVGVTLKAGANTVEVRARLNNGASSGWLGDGTVIVYR